MFVLRISLTFCSAPIKSSYDQASLLISDSFLFVLAIQTFAQQRMSPASYTNGPTPFISFVHLRFSPAVPVASAEFTIRPKSGSETRAVHASFSSSYLEARGYLDNTTGRLTVPVFGLYAGRANSVTVTMHFSDGTSRTGGLHIQTAVYDGGTYSNPVVIQPDLRYQLEL